MSPAHTPDPDDLQHKRLRLRLAAYACHENARQRIVAAIHNTELASAHLHFNAYFCETPAVWPFPARRRAPGLIAPFIDHEIARRTLSLHIDPGASDAECNAYLTKVSTEIRALGPTHPFRMPLAYTNPANIVALWQRFACLGPLSEGSLASQLFKAWCADRAHTDMRINCDPLRATECVADMKKKIASTVLKPAEKLAYVNVFALLYYALMTSSNPNDCLYFVAAPLCTKRTFHGVLIAAVEAPAGAGIPRASIDTVLGRVGAALVEEARNTYLPTLILSQNSWEEHLLHKHLEAGKTPAAFDARRDLVYSHLGRLPKPADTLDKENDNDALEVALITLWARRREAVKYRGTVVKDSLVFRKMMAASPGMISAIRQVTSLGLGEPKEPPLQAVLVVAPPGSGKEMMSELVPLFSSHFWDRAKRTINMGSVMLETRERGGGFLGLLLDLAADPLKDGGTLVLDELNSLDISAQPMLLRVLEEGKLERPRPAPATAKRASTTHSAAWEPLPWLVIGLINEDPARLTLESLRERVTEPIFGELLGSALYEHWKVKSRMRDDLYYRIRRCGEIRMTGLNDRRPDIPIVFYFRLRKLLEPKEVFLTYEATRRLIDPSLNWKGNMRKLEAVARHLKGIIERERSKESIIRIDEVHIETALQGVGMRKGTCANCGQRVGVATSVSGGA